MRRIPRALRSPRPNGAGSIKPRDRYQVCRRAALMGGRHAHAKRLKHHNREPRFLRTGLDRLIRDIRRNTDSV
jgi:hypothetical protein